MASFQNRSAASMLIVAAASLSGCQIHRAETSGKEYIQTSIPDCPISPVSLRVPIVGLFVGVNASQPGADLPPTPAHTVGAAYMYDLFTSTATSGRRPTLERSGTDQLTWSLFGSQTPDDFPTHKVALLSDLRMKPDDPELRNALEAIDPSNVAIKATRGGLDYVSGLLKRYDPFFEEPLNADGTWTYLGDGSIVQRHEIQEAISQATQQAAASETEHGYVVLVIYVAAHGVVSVGGTEYLLPGDSDKADKTTWLAKDDVIAQVATFLKGSDERRALVIFDTCRQTAAGAGEVPQQERRSIPNLVVVHTTSRDQYAWHYATTTRVEGEYDVDSEIRIGFPKRPEGVLQGRSETTYRSKMSVFPIAARCGVTLSVADLLQATPPDQFPAAFSLGDWLSATRHSMAYFLDQLTEDLGVVTEQQFVVEGEKDIPIFQTRDVERPESSP